MLALVTTHARGAAAAALACAALGVFAGCGEATLDSKSAEDQITEKSKAQGLEVKSVDCPDDIKAKKGEKGTCELTTAAGDKADVKLTMLDDDGKFEFEVQGQ
ncbi:MAG TPA: DUF4333 domain-containing protein [Thermoleophilaceae bacterium]|jgi:hypothetical protein